MAKNKLFWEKKKKFFGGWFLGKGAGSNGKKTQKFKKLFFAVSEIVKCDSHTAFKSENRLLFNSAHPFRTVPRRSRGGLDGKKETNF